VAEEGLKEPWTYMPKPVHTDQEKAEKTPHDGGAVTPIDLNKGGRRAQYDDDDHGDDDGHIPKSGQTIQESTAVNVIDTPNGYLKRMFAVIGDTVRRTFRRVRIALISFLLGEDLTLGDVSGAMKLDINDKIKRDVEPKDAMIGKPRDIHPHKTATIMDKLTSRYADDDDDDGGGGGDGDDDGAGDDIVVNRDLDVVIDGHGGDKDYSRGNITLDIAEAEALRLQCEKEADEAACCVLAEVEKADFERREKVRAADGDL
jgi:hypothetical protein